MRTQVAIRWAAAVWLSALHPVSYGSGYSYVSPTCSPLVTCPKVLRDPELSQSDSPKRCALPDHSYGVNCHSSVDTHREPASDYSYLPPQRYLPAPTPSPPVVRDPLPVRLREPERLTLTLLDQSQTDSLVCEARGKFTSSTLQAFRLAVAGTNVAVRGSVEELQFFFSRPSSVTSITIGEQGQESSILLQSLAEQGVVFAGLPDRHSPLAKFRRFHFPDLKTNPYEAMNHLTPNCIATEQPSCGPNTLLYRTHNGTCNNQHDALRGSARSAYDRFFPSDYEDGINKPRALGFDGTELPNPRQVSIDVGRSNRETSFDKFRTIGLMLFSQFIDHDLTSTPTASFGEDKGVKCCGKNGTFTGTSHHPSCISIPVPPDDPEYMDIDCMNQLRSESAKDPSCVPRPTAQQNQITHYLDGSNIYGSSDSDSNKLREFSLGRMKMPNDSLSQDKGNFTSGDTRTNENIGLTFFHLVWTREHNRVAAKLAEKHIYDDEQLYQEARRIVIAEYQHTVYNEWLPTILGYDFAVKWGLIAGAKGAYDSSRRAVIANEFSTAAFRFGHSMVQDVFRLGQQVQRDLRVDETFFKTQVLKEETAVLALAESLTSQKPGWVDRDFSDTIRHKLFERADLIALNINRGRDHGLQPYIAAVEHCLSRAIHSWEDYEGLLHPEAIVALREIYKDYRDVDMYIGLVSEMRVPNAVFGPTLQCLVGQQFVDLRLGDRFFYDNMGLKNSFTEEQLAEVRLSSLARIYCDNVPDLHEVQPLVLLQPEFFTNSRQSCDSMAIPTVDLAKF